MTTAASTTPATATKDSSGTAADEKLQTLTWQLDVTGRLHRIRLAYSNGLAAVFEAVVNSIQSVVENPSTRPPKVDVYIRSDVQQTLDGGSERTVTGFEIVDNGAGFNQANLRSFRTPDSMNKADKGGKGVGRLLWLRVFKAIRVSSEFIENGGTQGLSFCVTASGIEEFRQKRSDFEAWRTSVTLSMPEIAYKPSLQVGAKRLAEDILAHSLQLFLASNRPSVVIHDEVTGEAISLSDLLASDLCTDIKEEQVTIDGEKFDVQHVLRVGRANSRHEFVLCAAGREIQKCRLDDHIRTLQGQVVNVEDRPAKYTVLVSGPYLDSLASQERQDLLWGNATKSEGLALNAERICGEIAVRAREFLGERLKPLEEQKDSRIRSFLAANPFYEYLYKQYRTSFDHVSPTATDDEIDLEFYRVEQDYGRSARKEMHDFLKDADPSAMPEQRCANLVSIMSRVNHVGQSRLARHVAYRRAVIDFLQENLEEVNDRHSYEEVLHAVICPMDRNSDDDGGVIDANLWLVDERFSYHRFLASDQPVDRSNKQSGKPDVAIFERAEAYGDDRDSIGSVIVLELKRPGRDDYQVGVAGKDPVKQVREYAEEMHDGRAKDAKGAILTLREGVPLFAYIIADLTASLMSLLRSYDFKKTADGEGYSWYHSGLSLTVEIVPYRKLLRDAKKRNQMLFTKLGIPASSW